MRANHGIVVPRSPFGVRKQESLGYSVLLIACWWSVPFWYNGQLYLLLKFKC